VKKERIEARGGNFASILKFFFFIFIRKTRKTFCIDNIVATYTDIIHTAHVLGVVERIQNWTLGSV